MQKLSASRSRRSIMGPLISGAGGSPAPIIGGKHGNC
jgi:hypothetical protein